MRRFLPAALSLVFAAACSGGDTPSGSLGSLTIDAPATQFASIVSEPVNGVPTVTVHNGNGRGVSGVLVRWAVVNGGGHVGNDTMRTNASGIASSGGWTLGPTAGTQTLQASIEGASPVIFTASAVASAATRLLRVNASLPATIVGTAVAAPLSVRAVDAGGNPVANVPVLFSVTAGGGSITGDQAITNADGVATAGTWTLGTTSGTQTLRASSGALIPGDLDVSAVAAAPVSLSIVAGDKQSAFPGTAVPQPPIVRALDEFGNSVGNVPVTFTPGTGSGSVTGGTVVTDPATGTAVVSAWILGSAPAQTLVASSSMLPDKSVTFNAVLSSSQFDIEVRFVGDGGTDRQRQAFAAAAARWRSVIVGDEGTMAINVPAGECASWLPAIKENVNDLLIFVRLTSIDGPGKILGQASPCYINSATRLPVVGFFELDTDDLASMLSRGTLDDAVLHEMGHILGIGTMWSYQRTLLTGRGTDDPYFTGPSTRDQFARLGGVTYAGNAVPVENSGGAGTRDAHWRRTVFTNELMQGYSQPGGMPLSRVTVASLADLGYSVSFTGSDSFSFFPSLMTLTAPDAVPLGDDIVDSSLWELDHSGVRRKVKTGTERR